MSQFIDPKVVLGPPSNFTKAELVRAIRQALAAEEEATSLYKTIADATDDTFIKKVLNDIADEEIVHKGELQEVLSYLTDGEEDKLFQEGREEAREMLSEEKTAKIAKRIVRDIISSSDNLLEQIISQRDIFGLKSKTDDQTFKLAVDLYRQLGKDFTLNSRQKEAINRLSMSVRSNYSVDMHRNNIFKAANSLGIKLPSMSF